MAHTKLLLEFTDVNLGPRWIRQIDNPPLEQCIDFLVDVRDIDQSLFHRIHLFGVSRQSFPASEDDRKDGSCAYRISLLQPRMEEVPP